jgi:hypothetical protein
MIFVDIGGAFVRADLVRGVEPMTDEVRGQVDAEIARSRAVGFALGPTPTLLDGAKSFISLDVGGFAVSPLAANVVVERLHAAFREWIITEMSAQADVMAQQREGN